MNGHPDGIGMTEDLLGLAGLKPPGRVVDLGAGAGDSVAWLRELGFDACGVDVEPRGDAVDYADFRALPFDDGAFDAALAECSLYESGDAARGLHEAYRVLRPGGTLLLSDVFFGGATQAWADLVQDAGFTVQAVQDATEAWKRYYARCLWEGTAPACAPGAGRDGKVSGYFLMIGRKDVMR